MESSAILYYSDWTDAETIFPGTAPEKRKQFQYGCLSMGSKLMSVCALNQASASLRRKPCFPALTKGSASWMTT